MNLANFINNLLALEGDEPEASAKTEIKYLTFLANHCPAVFSTPGRGLIRGVAPPALLCHKEPAQGTQSPTGSAVIDPIRAWKPPSCHEEPARGKKCP